jgi:hypothetical protein
VELSVRELSVVELSGVELSVLTQHFGHLFNIIFFELIVSCADRKRRNS